MYREHLGQRLWYDDMIGLCRFGVGWSLQYVSVCYMTGGCAFLITLGCGSAESLSVPGQRGERAWLEERGERVGFRRGPLSPRVVSRMRQDVIMRDVRGEGASKRAETLRIIWRDQSPWTPRSHPA